MQDQLSIHARDETMATSALLKSALKTPFISHTFAHNLKPIDLCVTMQT
jgi:hypothetical protein